MEDEILIIEEELINGQTNQKVKGVRIMLDGEFRKALDKKIASGKYNSYRDIIGSYIALGITDIINELKEKIYM